MEIIKLILSIVTFAIASIGIFIMGLRTILDPGRLDIFNTIGSSTTVVVIWAVYCITQALLIIHPRTLVIGCIMLLLNNVFIISVNLKIGNTGGALIEATAMLIPIMLIWLGHPYLRWSQFNAI